MTTQAAAVPLDREWLRAHPLPEPDHDTDKNERGRVLCVGGSVQVPGGLLLTATAALRAGAGKVQLAVPEVLAIPLGVALPEAGIVPLPAERGAWGEVLGKAAAHADAVILGPAMGHEDAAVALDALADCKGTLLLDAAALGALAGRGEAVRGREGDTILTPHAGEMCAVLECEMEAVEADREGHVARAAETFAAATLLKGATSLIAMPVHAGDGALLAMAGGGPGLATGGSGDVLAGLAGAFAARGADALTALAWATWLHGEAGRRCAENNGSLGYLARELLEPVPALMSG